MGCALVTDVAVVPAAASVGQPQQGAHSSSSCGSRAGTCCVVRVRIDASSSDPPCQLRPGLFIGSSDSEQCLPALQAAGISHILQCGAELSPSHAHQQAGLRYLQLQLSDEETQDLVGVFQQAFEFIDEGRKHGGGVLVHCAQGVSRSASVLLGYLMWMTHKHKHQHVHHSAEQQQPEQQQPEQQQTRHSQQQPQQPELGYEAALAELRAVRPQVAPNPGFALQLRAFYDSGCCLDGWPGWGAARMAQCFEAASVSRRREVSGLSAMIRCFHMADVGEEDTVLDSTAFLLCG